MLLTYFILFFKLDTHSFVQTEKFETTFEDLKKIENFKPVIYHLFTVDLESEVENNSKN